MTVKNLLVAAATVLALVDAPPAGAIEILNNSGATTERGQPVLPATAATAATVSTPPAQPSELPEPDVFAMMLLGLVLIGYRARRDSSEKFK